MPIVFERTMRVCGDGWDEYRSFFSGVDGDEAEIAHLTYVTGGWRSTLYARYFWFSFQGVRYRSLAYVAARLERLADAD